MLEIPARGFKTFLRQFYGLYWIAAEGARYQLAFSDMPGPAGTAAAVHRLANGDFRC
jgi:hypothetical protein